MQIQTPKILPLPVQGEESDFAIRLSNYISKFDSTWKARIHPATLNTIETFNTIVKSKVSNSPIPSLYYTFLAMAGENDGGLITDSLSDGEISLHYLNNLYAQRVNGSDPELKKSLYIPFYFCPISDLEFSFDLSSPVSDTIVRTYRGELYSHTSDSFEKLIFRCALRHFYVNSGYRLLAEESSEYTFATFCINSTRDFCDTFKDLTQYLIMLHDLEHRFTIHEVWFSNTDGYENDCYVGVCDTQRVMITMRHCESTLFGTISGYNTELIQELVNHYSNFHRIKFGTPPLFEVF